MPKITRSDEEVAEVKEKILLRALDILVEDGFDNLSMHKLGSRMNMTAANLYNYYRNKDELLIAIHKKTFGMLYDHLKESVDAGSGAVDKVERLVRSFIEFGIKHPVFYDIMFNRDIPQYSDYVGTAQEDLSFDEYQSSIKSLLLSVNVVGRLMARYPELSNQDPKFYTIKIISELHGIISLYNSRILFEMDEKPDVIIERIIEEILKPIWNLA